jgi:hypothetical protein
MTDNEIAELRQAVRDLTTERDQLLEMIAPILERVRMGVMCCIECDGHVEHNESCPWGEYAER